VKYRHVGASGLEVSELSLGAATFGRGAMNEPAVREALELAYAAGVNYFDTAENYGGGAGEELMGRVLRALGWPRVSYVLASKYFWGLGRGPNQRNTLNRKYLLQAVDGSLQRLQLDYIDLIYCHRPDPHTPLEETVWAMSDLIARGKALYWGTSEWSPSLIRSACEIADRHHLRKPIVEQPEYNLLHRRNVDRELAAVCAEWGVGLITWSPLAGGALTGKYVGEVPADSRAGSPGTNEELTRLMLEGERTVLVAKLLGIARDIGCSLTHLAIAWCTLNQKVCSVITGCSRPAQAPDNLRALEVSALLTPEVLARIEAAVGEYDSSWVGGAPWNYR
jgi:voltage-dependent potassium channel beta subunit